MAQLRRLFEKGVYQVRAAAVEPGAWSGIEGGPYPATGPKPGHRAHQGGVQAGEQRGAFRQGPNKNRAEGRSQRARFDWKSESEWAPIAMVSISF